MKDCIAMLKELGRPSSKMPPLTIKMGKSEILSNHNTLYILKQLVLHAKRVLNYFLLLIYMHISNPLKFYSILVLCLLGHFF